MSTRDMVYVDRAKLVMLEKTLKQYEELRAVIDDGHESMTHENAINEVKYLRNMAESCKENEALKKEG